MNWLWLVPLVLLIIFIGSPRFRGDIAETRVRRILSTGLKKDRYTVFNDLNIPSGGGTRRIDHLVVSRFGLFVITSQHARGLVSGGEFQQQWKQRHLGRNRLFDNPLHRNALQKQALENLLKFPASKLHPIVVMVGHSGFKKPMPGNVLPSEGLIPYIRKQSRQLLESEQADLLLQEIRNARIKPDGGLNISRWSLLQFLLILALLGGAYLVFRDDVSDLQKKWAQAKEKEASRATFHPDGRRKSAQELWEDSLICAYSSDSGRCSCYEPAGARVDLGPEKCRSLAERGSVLKQ